MSKNVRVGIIGLGARTETLLASFVGLNDVEVVAVCDLMEERIEKIVKILERYDKSAPKTFTDYHDMLACDEVEAVFVPTSWNSHLSIAIDCMNAGKYVAIEVGGAASVDELWKLVHAYEKTGKPCMMLENCCYARNELMVMNMVRQGLFGELVYCEGGYEHCLRKEMSQIETTYEERAFHNLHRNGELYPTHELVPYLHGWGDYSCKGFDEILDVATEYNMVVNVHATVECSDEMDKMVKKHPKTVFVAAHPGEEETFCRHLQRMEWSNNYYLDLSGEGLHRHGLLRHGINEFGAERFLFGSDYPTCNPAMLLGGVLLDTLLTEEEKRLILADNAKRLLGL